MRSVTEVSVQKPNTHQNLYDAIVLKVEQQLHYNTPTNTDLNLKIKNGLQTSHEARLQETNEEAEAETVRHSSGAKASREGIEKVDTVTEMLFSKAHVSATVSSTLSLMSGTEQSTAALQSFSAAHILTIAPVSKTIIRQILLTVMAAPVSPAHYTKSDLPLRRSDEHQQAEAGFQYPLLSQPQTQEPTEASTSTLSTSSSVSSPASSALSFSSPVATFPASASSSSRLSMKTPLRHVTLPENTSSTTGYHNLTTNTTSKLPLQSPSLHRQPVCLYPPVPAHGTFYFRNIENPEPREYRHYIQYACYPGYTLAHGDVHSYCQQGGTWSGITPVCLGELYTELIYTKQMKPINLNINSEGIQKAFTKLIILSTYSLA